MATHCEQLISRQHLLIVAVFMTKRQRRSEFLQGLKLMIDPGFPQTAIGKPPSSQATIYTPPRDLHQMTPTSICILSLKCRPWWFDSSSLLLPESHPYNRRTSWITSFTNFGLIWYVQINSTVLFTTTCMYKVSYYFTIILLSFDFLQMSDKWAKHHLKFLGQKQYQG